MPLVGKGRDEMNIFEIKCPTCDGTVMGPRLYGKARGAWLGHDRCLKCRKAEKAETEKGEEN